MNRFLWTASTLLVLTAMQSVAAAPRNLTSDSEWQAPPIRYSLFTIDAKKLKQSVAQAKAALQSQLNQAGTGITACFVAGDLNVNNVNCGNGSLRLGGDLFTYNLESNIPKPAIAFDKAIGVTQGVNFRSPAPGTVGESGRVVQFRFKQRLVQFGLWVDPVAVEGLQFIVNRQALPMLRMTPGQVRFVGVEDRHGFNELTLIAAGGNRAFVSDVFSLVPHSDF